MKEKWIDEIKLGKLELNERKNRKWLFTLRGNPINHLKFVDFWKMGSS